MYKRQGQYKQVIGFLDLVIYVFKNDRRKLEECDFLAVEVKIHRVSVSDIIRQMNLYREFEENIFGGSHTIWTIATRFDISEAEVKMLETADLWHVRLGPGFDAYLEAQKQPSAQATMVEI